MMIVKTPLKKKNARRNRRTSPPRGKKKGKSRVLNPGGRRNGTANGNGTVYGKRKKSRSSGKKSALTGFSAWKIILGALVIGALGTLYLSHVFATQDLLRDVERLETEYNKAKRLHADYRLTYDRMIGPKEIYQNAKELGFINGGPADNVIEVESTTAKGAEGN